jgi:hypothetical protein
VQSRPAGCQPTARAGGIDSPTAFGLDADGEAYVVDYDGEVYRLEPAI